MSDPDSHIVDIDENKRSTAQAKANLGQFAKIFDIDSAIVIDGLSAEGSVAGAKPSVRVSQIDGRTVLFPFIISVMLAADWYASHMKSSWRMRSLFSVVSLGLMAILPVAIWWANSQWPHGLSGPLSAILTGVLALQKTTAAWLDTHRRYGNQWRARAALRDILYGLETVWSGRAVQSGTRAWPLRFSSTFLANLSVATQQARSVIRAEQQQFFDSYSFPTPDILSALTGARSGVSNLMQALTPAQPQASRPAAGVMAAEGPGGTSDVIPFAPAGTKFVGKTNRFSFFYDPALGGAGQNVASGLQAHCERDLDEMLVYFNSPPNLSGIVITLVDKPVDGTGMLGGLHMACSGTDILVCVGATSPPQDLAFARQAVVAELVEVVAAGTAQVWYCLSSSGEGLSRAIANDLHRGAVPSNMLWGSYWLNTNRPDWVNDTNVDPGADGDRNSVGCAVLFLNWMRFALNIPWVRITAATGATLADVYGQVAGPNNPADGFQTFFNVMKARYDPKTNVADIPDDNPFVFQA